MQLNTSSTFERMDLWKGFDTIEHKPLMDALCVYGVHESYIALLQALYPYQYAANGSSTYTISRGIKQGDIFSSVPSTCTSDMTFECWYVRLTTKLHFDSRFSSSTNKHPVCLWYDVDAKSLDELKYTYVYVYERGINQGNCSYDAEAECKEDRGPQTWAWHSSCDIGFVAINNYMIEILPSKAAHHYFGRTRSRHLFWNRDDDEVQHRKGEYGELSSNPSVLSQIINCFSHSYSNILIQIIFRLFHLDLRYYRCSSRNLLNLMWYSTAYYEVYSDGDVLMMRTGDSSYLE